MYKVNKILKSFIVICLLITAAWPTLTEASGTYGIINGDSVRIRTGPGLEYPVISYANKGDKFEVVGVENDWVKVKLMDGRLGYVSKSLIDLQQQKQAIVLPSTLNVYEKASTRTAVIGTLSKDTKVTILQSINGWHQITSAALNGWVYGNLLESNFTVTISKVDIYESASTRSTIKSHLYKNEQGIINKEINGWYYIVSGTKSGWIYSGHLVEESSQLSVPLMKEAIVLSAELKVYEKASTRTAVIGKLVKDTSVTVHEEINGWYRISNSKISGWVYGNLLNSNFKIAVNAAYVYEKASTRSSVINRLDKGESGKIVKEINGWYYINSLGRTGWVYSAHLTQQSAVPASYGQPAIVLPDKLNVYEKASTRTAIIGSFVKNQPVKILKEVYGWYLVNSGNLEGWVYGGLLKSSFNVDAGIVNVYENASVRSIVIDNLNIGDSGTILQEINGWYYIKAGETEGWVYYTHLEDGSPTPVISLKENAITLPDKLSVYLDPSTRSDIIGSFIKDTPVVIDREINGWYHVSSQTLSGWVYGNILKSKVTVNVANVDVYLNPTTRTTIVSNLVNGNTTTIKKELSGWYYIEGPSAVKGWIYSSHLKTGSPALPKLNAVVINSSSVYYEPTSSSIVTGSVTRNQQVTVRREVDGFYFIESGTVNGWIPVGNALIVTKMSSLAGRTIVLDPGHGGFDSGAVGKVYSTYEKERNLTTAKILKEKLKPYGVNVIMTRTTDIYLSLSQRVQISHAYDTDLFVSIHYNSASSTAARGVETLYYYSRDSFAAETLQNSIVSATSMYYRDVRFQDLHVLRENNNPSVLLELGFLSNADDELRIRSLTYQEQATNGIINGLIKYFNTKQ